MSKPKTVDEYIAGFPAEVASKLEQIRQIIRQNVPAADEVISYDMPTYKVNGSLLIYFAGWKKHIALYPVSGSLSEDLREEIARYQGSKDAVHFLLKNELPLDLIERIVAARLRRATSQGVA